MEALPYLRRDGTYQILYRMDTEYLSISVKWVGANMFIAYGLQHLLLTYDRELAVGKGLLCQFISYLCGNGYRLGGNIQLGRTSILFRVHARSHVKCKTARARTWKPKVTPPIIDAAMHSRAYHIRTIANHESHYLNASDIMLPHCGRLLSISMGSIMRYRLSLCFKRMTLEYLYRYFNCLILMIALIFAPHQRSSHLKYQAYY